MTESDSACPSVRIPDVRRVGHEIVSDPFSCWDRASRGLLDMARVLTVLYRGNKGERPKKA
jgi:hypothetical protein